MNIVHNLMHLCREPILLRNHHTYTDRNKFIKKYIKRFLSGYLSKISHGFQITIQKLYRDKNTEDKNGKLKVKIIRTQDREDHEKEEKN